MTDEIHFTHDAASFTLNSEKEGVTVDDAGDVQIEWDRVEREHVNDVPWADSFGTTEFYKLNGTIARPIKQVYQFGDTRMTLMKPREELKKAAWSAHNAPWTIKHPETGMVKNVDDIHGFWRNPRYIDSLDGLDVDLYVPVNDDDAKEYLSKYGNVSIGFYNKITRVDAYDGVVGGGDDLDGVDGFQTNIYIDHVASVPVGRCSDEDECGIHGHGMGVMHIDEFIKNTNTTQVNEDNEGENTDQSKYVNPDNGDWYAVPPEDNADDDWKFPINNCSDVEDAWKLRNQGNISISVETLEGRIKRRASDLGCDVPSSEESDGAIQVTETTDSFYKQLSNMTDEDTPCTDCGGVTGDAQFVADMSIDAVADKNEQVQELVDEVEELREKQSSHNDEIAVKDEKINTLQSKVDEYESDRKEELVEEITSRTDALGDKDELMELDLDDLEAKHELVLSLSSDGKNANSGGLSQTQDIPTVQRASPWD